MVTFGIAVAARFAVAGRAGRGIVAPPATATPTPAFAAAAACAVTTLAAPALTPALTLAVALLAVVVVVIIVAVFGGRDLVIVDDHDRRGQRCHHHRVRRRRARRVEDEVRPHQRLVGNGFDIDAVALLQLDDIGALAVEDVHRDFEARAQLEGVVLALDRFGLEGAERGERGRADAADIARAVAHRADVGRCFEDTGAEALAAHFHQAEAADPPDRDARAVVLHRLLHRALDAAVVAANLHVDEVDDDEARHVAQTQLAADFVGGLQIGLVRRLLDAVLARRAARIDVDRDERFGRVDDDVAA